MSDTENKVPAQDTIVQDPGKREFIKKTAALSAAAAAISTALPGMSQSAMAADSAAPKTPNTKEASTMANEATIKETTFKNTKLNTVPLSWKEVYYTNCPLVSASNVDQELGWTREEFKKIGVKYAFLRSVRENDWYPHYIHNLDNLIRFGGLFPPVHVQADIRRTRLLGVTHAPHEGGCMMVRARDDIYRMTELKGKKIGLSKSLNTIKNDWWRIQEEQGIELMLRMNGMTRADVEIVEFPYADDWYNKPDNAGPDGKPIRVVAQTRPQARPGIPSAGDRAIEWHRRCDLHPKQTLPASPGGNGKDEGDRGSVPISGLDPAGGQHPRRHHLHRRNGSEAP